MAADVVTLRAGGLQARFVPSVGMVGASLFAGGHELLGQLGGLDAYASRGSSFGIPLLHPWANRLGGFTYSAAGEDVVIDAAAPGVRTEQHGLPIHGLLAAHPGWAVRDAGERTLSAELAYDTPALLTAFPFPHVLRMDVRLDPEQLTIATTLTPTTDRPVPVSFGFHPYLALPGVAREDVVLRHGPMTHLALDERGLPTGAREAVDARDAPLGDAVLDDLYTDLGDRPEVVMASGDRELAVRLLEGYTHLQLFTPPAQPSLAIEPMTAATDALRSGDGLRLATAPFTATFAILVHT